MKSVARLTYVTPDAWMLAVVVKEGLRAQAFAGWIIRDVLLARMNYLFNLSCRLLEERGRLSGKLETMQIRLFIRMVNTEILIMT